MLKRQSVLSIAMLAALVCGTVDPVFADNGKGDKAVHFKVLVENITNQGGVAAQYGTKNMFGLSPGVFTISKKKTSLFEDGEKASAAIEAMAEDGRIDLFRSDLIAGTFSKPIGADKPGPIFGGGSYEFEFVAAQGERLNFVTMYGPSNDLFYAPRQAINLFDTNGNPTSGDVTDKLLLWDAGTEVNQPSGIGADQAPLQKTQNTGADEHGVVRPVNDGFKYPQTKSVLRVTISVQ